MFDLKLDLFKINANDSVNDDMFDYKELEEHRQCEWDHIIEPNCFPSFDCQIENSENIGGVEFWQKSDLTIQTKGCGDHLASISHDEIITTSKGIDIDLRKDQNKERTEIDTATAALKPEENYDYSIENPKVECIEKVVEELTKTNRIPSIEDVSSLKSLKEIVDNKYIEDSNKQKRFGRKDDRDLFARLRQLCIESGKNISDFWNVKPIDKSLHDVLSEVVIYTSYKGSIADILKRIKKLGEKQEFSVREKKIIEEIDSNATCIRKNCYKQHRILLSWQNNGYS